ncbi:hypothetical protein LR48_Vigan801s000100 [Vigna angularis]|uniref:Uncharacterized protein n=1 Tax=Phaseolus angularis TaxID=3914 RepID=A0A0L9TI25_PHAAN|nr:hypothetical protein LR48_Vigan801s000100 [Vigna angularis]
MDAWQDLVYDDDVLESFLKKYDASASLIPGPAGNIQAAFLNRTGKEEPKSTQEFAGDVAQATYERDFNSNAWKWAQMFIEHHGEFGERSEEGERWNQKRHQKVQKEKPQLPLNGSLPLSGTQELTGDPLRGKMGAEGKKPTHALTAKR